MGAATLNPTLRSFWEAPARNRVLFGGRASSKSWDAAGVALYSVQAKSLKIMCVRQFQNRIDDSVYTLLKNRIKGFGFNCFDVKRNTIECVHNDSSFVFYGLWRHIEEIKSTEGIDILWIEEAHNLTKEQWDILEPTIRKSGSQIWIIFNPKLVTDFVYKRFVLNPPPNTIVRKINYDENPFLSETMHQIIAAKQVEDEDDFNHIYLGEPLEDDDQVIIKRSWIKAALDAHIKLGIEPSGKHRVGFDVADSGEDKNASVHAYGIVAKHIDEWKGGEDELLKSASRVHSLAVRHNAEIDYDSIGVGAFAGSYFKQLNADPNVDGSVDYFKFNASGEVLNKDKPMDKTDPKSPKNGDFFSNIKAQAWWDVARRFRNTFNAVTKGHKFDEDDLISISTECDHLDALIDELSTPRKDFDQRGKVKVESKKDLAKRLVLSPNKADAFIMAYTPRAYKTAPKKIKIGMG